MYYVWKIRLMPTITVWILGDQLLEKHPAVQKAEDAFGKEGIVILMIESEAIAQRLPYHGKKLLLLFSAMRHYAASLRQQGYQVDYRRASDMSMALSEHIAAYHPHKMLMMTASSYRGKAFQNRLAKKAQVDLRLLPNTQFLSGLFEPLLETQPQEKVRQENFYRAMRQRFQLFMDDSGKPIGGKWNYDQKNRQPLPEGHIPPEAIRFDPDPITRNIMGEVGKMGNIIGHLDGFDLAVTRQDALLAADDFFQTRLHNFGTYEDAMSDRYDLLYHSKLSPYLNLGLLTPLELAQKAEQYYFAGKAEINNVEGFIRQVIGWREYIYWQYHRLMPELSKVNYWGFDRSLPEFFWNAETDLNCLRQIIQRVLKDGYAHHIERLMVISNFCLLAEINPTEVLDWFKAVFVDAYDWVMVPNVYGMGLYADGGQVATKPYMASANYIHKMGNFCNSCDYNHKKRTGEKACPFNFLYWHFLIKHENKLRQNYRMARMLYHLKNFDEAERKTVIATANQFLESLR